MDFAMLVIVCAFVYVVITLAKRRKAFDECSTIEYVIIMLLAGTIYFGHWPLALGAYVFAGLLISPLIWGLINTDPSMMNDSKPVRVVMWVGITALWLPLINMVFGGRE